MNNKNNKENLRATVAAVSSHEIMPFRATFSLRSNDLRFFPLIGAHCMAAGRAVFLGVLRHT